MISSDRPLAIDPAALNELSQILPCAPTLNSEVSNDNGFFLFHYDRHPVHEVPEYVMDYHIVAIWGAKSQANLESRLDGQLNCGLFGHGANGIIPAGYSHRAVWDQEIALTVLFLHPMMIDQAAPDKAHGRRIEIMPKHNTEDPVLSQLGQLLKTDLEAGHPSGRLYRESIAMAFSARLVSHHSVCSIQSESMVSLSQNRVQMIVSYIHEYLEQEIRLSDLAQLVDLNEYYLCRLFKQSIGMPLHQYVIQQRLERAKQLLKRQELSISRIAQDCGFSSHSHLTQHFKRAFGVSPSILRSQDFDR
jgi:AraC family transcriptional regulator